jgi:hypothetical protein
MCTPSGITASIDILTPDKVTAQPGCPGLRVVFKPRVQASIKLRGHNVSVPAAAFEVS